MARSDGEEEARARSPHKTALSWVGSVYLGGVLPFAETRGGGVTGEKNGTRRRLKGRCETWTLGYGSFAFCLQLRPEQVAAPAPLPQIGSLCRLALSLFLPAPPRFDRSGVLSSIVRGEGAAAGKKGGGAAFLPRALTGLEGRGRQRQHPPGARLHGQTGGEGEEEKCLKFPRGKKEWIGGGDAGTEKSVSPPPARRLRIQKDPKSKSSSRSKLFWRVEKGGGSPGERGKQGGGARAAGARMLPLQTPSLPKGIGARACARSYSFRRFEFGAFESGAWGRAGPPLLPFPSLFFFNLFSLVWRWLALDGPAPLRGNGGVLFSTLPPQSWALFIWL